jgi:cob(I)alamin adenosyltransferase
VVGIAGAAPRQIAPVTAVPAQESSPERPAGAGVGKRPEGRCCAWRPHSTGLGIIIVVKIYTRTGDSGETALLGGARVSKADLRVAAYGEVDELNAWLGLAASGMPDYGLKERLVAIQRDLFALGSRLADPAHRVADRIAKTAIGAAEVSRLEGWIDELDAELPPLRRFILAGGTPPGAALHVARTVCRRAERAMVELGEGALEPELLQYVNRLSDLLFTMARAANHRAGVAEIEW